MKKSKKSGKEEGKFDQQWFDNLIDKSITIHGLWKNSLKSIVRTILKGTVSKKVKIIIQMEMKKVEPQRTAKD